MKTVTLDHASLFIPCLRPQLNVESHLLKYDNYVDACTPQCHFLSLCITCCQSPRRSRAVECTTLHSEATTCKPSKGSTAAAALRCQFQARMHPLTIRNTCAIASLWHLLRTRINFENVFLNTISNHSRGFHCCWDVFATDQWWFDWMLPKSSINLWWAIQLYTSYEQFFIPLYTTLHTGAPKTHQWLLSNETLLTLYLP